MTRSIGFSTWAYAPGGAARWALARGSALLLVVLWPAGAAAQMQPGGGNGIAVGNGRMHPYGQLDCQYVTNPGRVHRNGANDIVLVARPGLDVEFESETLELKLGTSVEYLKFLGIENPETKELSSFAGDLQLEAVGNKDTAVSWKTKARALRSAEPFNQSEGVRVEHTLLEPGLILDIKPGGGALILSLGYSFFLDYYDRGNTAFEAELLDNLRHMPKAKVTWKFLPKTAFFVEVESQITRYFSETRSGLHNADANVLNAYLGAVGNLTPRLELLLKAGYGNTFIEDDPTDPEAGNFSSVVGHVEGTYRFSETFFIRGGFLRTAQPTSVFNYFAMLRSYIEYDHVLLSRLQVGVKLRYDDLRYGETSKVDDPEGGRRDSDLTGDLRVSLQLTEWLVLSATESLNIRTSNFDNLGEASRNAGYTYNRLIINISARY